MVKKLGKGIIAFIIFYLKIKTVSWLLPLFFVLALLGVDLENILSGDNKQNKRINKKTIRRK